MSQAAIRLPVRRPGLVTWCRGGDDDYVLRNRQTGESFQVGAEEQFLLGQLDGTQTSEAIRAAYAERFGEPLSPSDLAEYLTLASGRGLLQDPGTADSDTGAVPPALEQPGAASTAATPVPGPGKRFAARSLKAASHVLEWSAWLPSALHGWLQYRTRLLEFVPRSDDVFLVTYPRSGTTWMQMILYQLTTDGALDFPHIAEFCPWFERSIRSAFELRPSPRIFKSHLSYRQIPKGAGRYIYVARNGKDVAVSYYHLYRRYNGYEGTFDEFFPRFLKGRVGFGSWFEHVQAWWQHRHDDNVLFLTYEELKRDLDGCVRKIADFCGWDLPPEKLQAVQERSSFDFMKQHESRFDPALERLWEEGVQLKSFLRSGRMGDGELTLSVEQHAQFERESASRLGRMGIPWS